MAKADIRYRDIALTMSAEDVDKYLDRQVSIKLDKEIEETVKWLDDNEGGIILRCIFSYHRENRGRMLKDYQDPAEIRESAPGNKTLRIAWAAIGPRLMDDMMRYCAKASVNNEAAKKGGQASAEAREEKLKEEWARQGEMADVALNEERRRIAEARENGIDPDTGEIMDPVRAAYLAALPTDGFD